jgi:hypothetical protein
MQMPTPQHVLTTHSEPPAQPADVVQVGTDAQRVEPGKQRPPPSATEPQTQSTFVLQAVKVPHSAPVHSGFGPVT